MSTGSYNIAIGTEAGNKITSATDNVAIGRTALYANTSGVIM